MKKNKALFMLPSIFIFLLIAAFPIFKILTDIKKVENFYFSVGVIVYLLILILLLIILFIEEIYLINYLITKLEMNIFKKMLWIVLLLGLNILIIPYFYMKYMTKEDKLLPKCLIYLIPMVLFSFIFFFGLNSYNEDISKIKAERKRIEEERNTYKTKDGVVSFTFRHGYKDSVVGEFDLYVQNKSKKVILSAFTYETKRYEQKTPDDYINKGVSDLSQGKEKFEKTKDKEAIEKEDKLITTVEYTGKTKDSSLCVYKVSVISFKNKPDYLVYVTEVVTEKNYKLYKSELMEILESAKIN